MSPGCNTPVKKPKKNGSIVYVRPKAAASVGFAHVTVGPVMFAGNEPIFSASRDSVAFPAAVPSNWTSQMTRWSVLPRALTMVAC